ncbi:BssG [Georgfuchsia toluolica]|uniref:BssG n=1 Tax=Georgfuchsia toluolica TaxID=424218 RepID=A0A916J742_9PROT|nr:DUF4125 family protein [Georgfuchsia toluolica]CAG4882131.1 BssG [Georgfuchsia toluolica]CAG4885451.1 BssG [Georgfuchsia toluolica]
MKSELLDQVLAMEWQMFVRVKSAHRASCQSAPDNFKMIRSSLFETWTEEMLASYLDDLKQAADDQRNLLMEKYARMDNLIPPLSDNPLIPIIVAIENVWQDELQHNFPALYQRCCRSMAQTGDGKNFSIYLGCELETYGDHTLELYYENLNAALEQDRNLAIEALQRLVHKNGYRDLAHAEQELSRLCDVH